jgi:signal transduction histidine kinase
VDIKTFLNPKLVGRVQPIPPILNGLVIVIALAVLGAWLFGSKSELARMAPETAISMIASTIALQLLRTSRKTGGGRKLAKALGAAVLITGCVVLIEHLRGVSIGGMEPITAINLILVGFALCFFEARTPHDHSVSHLIAFVIALVAFLPLIGYLYGSRFLIGIGPASEMPAHTAFCFLFLAVSFFLSDLDDDLATVLLSDGPGGYISRRLLPAAVVFPLGLGWIRVAAENKSILSTTLGTAVFTTATIAVFLLLVWYQALVLQHAEISRTQAERERETLKTQAEVREQFVSMLSHDLRNPISAAAVCAQMIRRTPDSAAALSEKITTILARADRLIQDLLDVNRIRSGRAIAIELSPCDLAKVLRETVEELSIVHGNRFVVKTEESLPGSWDCGLLRRAVENLAGNAVKYGSPQSPIRITARLEAQTLLLSVQNQGVPIPFDEQKKLFEVYERAISAQRHRTQGWGIGLTLVRGIAEAHGGKVFVESSEERGTTFTLELPVRRT